MSDERDDSLLRAMDALRARIELLEDQTDPVACVAQGKLEVALGAVKAAADLLGEGK